MGGSPTKTRRRDAEDTHEYSSLAEISSGEGEGTEESETLHAATPTVRPLKSMMKADHEKTVCHPDNTTWLTTVGIAILLNAILMGYEADYGEEGVVVLEHLFCWFFFIEMCMTIAAIRMAYFTSMSYLSDLFLVAIGMLNLYVLPYIASAGNPKWINMLRMLRLTRLLRVLRLLKMFMWLRIIMATFFEALSSVMWVGALLSVLNFTIAVALTVVVGHDAKRFGKDEDQVIEWFGCVGNSLRTLFIILTLAQWDDIALALGDVYGHYIVFPLFMLYILVTAFTMVSMITGIITDKLIEIEQTEMELKLAEMKVEQAALKDAVMQVVKDLDHDGSGRICHEEVLAELKQNPDILYRLQAMDISLEAEHLANLVLHAPSAAISEEGAPLEELAEGLMQLNGTAKASEMFLLKRQLSKLHESVDDIDSQLDALLAVSAGASCQASAIGDDWAPAAPPASAAPSLGSRQQGAPPSDGGGSRRGSGGHMLGRISSRRQLDSMIGAYRPGGPVAQRPAGVAWHTAGAQLDEVLGTPGFAPRRSPGAASSGSGGGGNVVAPMSAQEETIRRLSYSTLGGDSFVVSATASHAAGSHPGVNLPGGPLPGGSLPSGFGARGGIEEALGAQSGRAGRPPVAASVAASSETSIPTLPLPPAKWLERAARAPAEAEAAPTETAVVPVTVTLSSGVAVTPAAAAADVGEAARPSPMAAMSPL